MAVKQQQHLFSELRDAFARRLTNHLNNVFVHQVTYSTCSTQVKYMHTLNVWQWAFFPFPMSLLSTSVCD